MLVCYYLIMFYALKCICNLGFLALLCFQYIIY